MLVELQELPLPDGTTGSERERIRVLRYRLLHETESPHQGEGSVLVWRYGRAPVPAALFRDAFLKVPDGQPDEPPAVRVRVKGVEVTCSTCGHYLTGPVSGYVYLDGRDIREVEGSGYLVGCKVCGGSTELPDMVQEMFPQRGS